MGVWTGSLINLLSYIGPNRPLMRTMRSKMRKIRLRIEFAFCSCVFAFFAFCSCVFAFCSCVFALSSHFADASSHFSQIRFRTVPIDPNHFVKGDCCETAVQHNSIELAQIRELPVPLLLLFPTPCPIPPVPLVVSFTYIHIRSSFAFAFSSPLLSASALRFCPKTPRHKHICASSWHQKCTKSALASKIKVKVTPTKGQIIRVMRQMLWNRHVTRQMSWNKRYATWNKCITRQMSKKYIS
jgi:hypothetical protein